MNEKEKRIQELRTVEATRKNLMGLNGKLGKILKYMGEPIISQNMGGAYTDTNYLNPYDNFDEDKPEFPYMEGDHLNDEPLGDGWRSERNYDIANVSLSKIGWLFDSMDRGIHLEIKYKEAIKDADNRTFSPSILEASYKGYLVYQEVSGDLSAYVPSDEWEAHVDKLFLIAKEKEKLANIKEKREKLEMVEKAKTTFWESLKKRWGLTE